MMVLEKQKEAECRHFTVRRIIDKWKCLECGLEFVPKDGVRKHRRKE